MSSTLPAFTANWPWFASVIALGFVLRMIGLSHQSLWLDEMTSIQVASSPLKLIWSGQIFDNHTPPLYYILLHLWGTIVTLNEFGLRLFSTCIDVLNIVLLQSLCFEFFSKRISLLIVSAYAFSPFMLYYAQEGRMYTLAVFFALLYAFTITRLIKAKTNWLLWSILAGTVLAMGVYTHYYLAFYAVGVFTAALFVVRRSHRQILSIVLSGLIGVLLFVPWIPVVLQLGGSEGQTFRTYTYSMIPYALFRFVIGYAVFPLNTQVKEQFLRSVIAHAPYLFAVFATLALLAWNMFQTVKLRDRMSAAAIWVLAVPTVLGLLASLKVPMLSERYLIVSFPAFLFLCLAFQDFSRIQSMLAVGLFFLMLLVGNIAYFYNPNFGKAQWREAAHFVQDSSNKDDVIVFHSGFVEDVFRYYYRGPGEFRKANQTSVAELLKLDRLWLVLAHTGDQEKFQQRFRGTHRAAINKFYPLEVGIRVMLMVRN